MRQKKPSAVFTFSSTTQAMAAEDFCKARSLPGRLIPVPTQISAGCGLAWKTDAADRDALTAALQQAGLHWEAITEMLL